MPAGQGGGGGPHLVACGVGEEEQWERALSRGALEDRKPEIAGGDSGVGTLHGFWPLLLGRWCLECKTAVECHRGEEYAVGPSWFWKVPGPRCLRFCICECGL